MTNGAHVARLCGQCDAYKFSISGRQMTARSIAQNPCELFFDVAVYTCIANWALSDNEVSSRIDRINLSLALRGTSK